MIIFYFNHNNGFNAESKLRNVILNAAFKPNLPVLDAPLKR